MLDDTITTPLNVNPVLVIILDDHNYLINANDDEKLKCHIGITASIFLGQVEGHNFFKWCNAYFLVFFLGVSTMPKCNI